MFYRKYDISERQIILALKRGIKHILHPRTDLFKNRISNLGVENPPKKRDIIFEQPLILSAIVNVASYINESNEYFALGVVRCSSSYNSHASFQVFQHMLPDQSRLQF